MDAHGSGVEQAKTLARQAEILEDARTSLKAQVKATDHAGDALQKQVEIATQQERTLKQTGRQQIALLTDAAISLRRELTSSQKQQVQLQAQQRALGTVQDTLKRQLDDASAELAVIRQQQSAQLALQRRRPEIKLAVESQELGPVEFARFSVLNCDVGSGSWCRIVIEFRNVGDATLKDAAVLFTAQPASVFLDKGGFRLGERPNHNSYQEAFQAMIPYRVSKAQYATFVDVTPNAIQDFTIEVVAVGESETSVTGGAWRDTLHVHTIHGAGPGAP